jgi:hypothetical protein
MKPTTIARRALKRVRGERFVGLLALLGILSGSHVAQAQVPDLTGVWDVKTKSCLARNNDQEYFCAPGGPNHFSMQAVDSNIVLMRWSQVGGLPAHHKCVVFASADGKVFLSCAACGSDDFFDALAVEDGQAFIGAVFGRVLNADKMKLRFAHTRVDDGSSIPGIQPFLELLSGSSVAKRRDSSFPNITDCSTP